MDRTMIRPSNIQYHAGGEDMMGRPSAPIESGAIVVSIELALNFEVVLMKNMDSCANDWKKRLCLDTVKIEEMS